MTQEPPRPPLVQVSGQVAHDVVNGLKQSPALLAIVALNLIAILVAGWFMAKIITSSHENMQTLLRACFDGREDFGPTGR